MENQFDEMEISPKFVEGYNNGWLIAKHEPELSKALVVSLQRIEPAEENVFAEGIKEAILHYEFEKAKDRYKGTQLPDIGKSPDKDKGRTRE